MLKNSSAPTVKEHLMCRLKKKFKIPQIVPGQVDVVALSSICTKFYCSHPVLNFKNINLRFEMNAF